MALGATDPGAWALFVCLRGLCPRSSRADAALRAGIKNLQERKKAGTLRRPSFGALFSPEFRRVHGHHCGTVRVRIRHRVRCVASSRPAALRRPFQTRGERKALKPLTDEAKTLNGDFDQLMKGSQRALC